jgi:hypothetical protein
MDLGWRVSPRAPDRHLACYWRATGVRAHAGDWHTRGTSIGRSMAAKRRSDGRRNTRGPTRGTEYDTVCACQHAPLPISSAAAAAAAVICARTERRDERRCQTIRRRRSRPLLPPRHQRVTGSSPACRHEDDCFSSRRATRLCSFEPRSTSCLLSRVAKSSRAGSSERSHRG